GTVRPGGVRCGGEPARRGDAPRGGLLPVAGAHRERRAARRGARGGGPRGGAMLRGEVYSQWQELIASGELRAALRTAERPRRPRRTPTTEPPMPGRRFQTALADALARRVS